MKRAAKVLATVGLGGALAMGAASGAHAAISYPGGGTWNQGTSYVTMNTWSNYLHGSKAHGSTACNANRCNRSDTVPPGLWSYASIRATWGGNTTYWRA